MTSRRTPVRSEGDVRYLSSIRPLSTVQRRLLAVAGFGFLLDLATTWVVVTTTVAREGNPAMRWMMDLLGVPLGIVVTKLLAIALLAVAIALFPPGWRDRVFTLATALVAAVGVGFGAWNALLLGSL